MQSIEMWQLLIFFLCNTDSLSGPVNLFVRLRHNRGKTFLSLLKGQGFVKRYLAFLVISLIILSFPRIERIRQEFINLFYNSEDLYRKLNLSIIRGFPLSWSPWNGSYSQRSLQGIFLCLSTCGSWDCSA